MKNFYRSELFLLLSLIAWNGCYTEPQDPRWIFRDSQILPPSLAAIANPNPGISVQNLPAKTGPHIGVAVIDNGVDYLHKDLVRQIRFTRNNGKITGAGLDVMGGDFAGHSNLINPLFFSLVARGIENGQLVGVDFQLDPLQWLVSVQNDFAAQFTQAMRSHPELAGSLLVEKLTGKGVPLFFYALPRLLEDWKTYGRDMYEEMKREGNLYRFDSRLNLTPLRIRSGSDSVDAFFIQDWNFSAATGVPSAFIQPFLDFLMEKAAFMEVLEKLQLWLEQKYQAFTRLQRFDRYRSILSGESDPGAINAGQPAPHPLESIEIDKIVSAWYFASHQVYGAPALEFLQSLCNSIRKPARERLASPSLTTEERVALIRREISYAVGIAQALGNLKLANEKFDDEESRKELILNLQGMNKTLGFFDTLLIRNPVLKKYLSCAGDILKLAANDPVMLRYVQARKHPYLSEGSEAESHGTHVSGIIARQSPAIEIVPIRVTTSSPVLVSPQAEPIRAQFLEGFKRWIATPGISQSFAESPTARQVFGSVLTAEQLFSGMSDYMRRTFKNNYLDLLFFDQIKKAIQYVGVNRIKVANMSLGTKFDKAILTPNIGSRREVIDGFYSFLAYEFYKFDVAITIKKFASNTLFVIASGNDGAWLDGRSKSGLPCDLSSPSLRGLAQPVPNNQITNILCVGSIDNAKLISSFTNVPLSAIPYVLSYGESILSPVKTTDCSGVRDQMQNEMKDVFPISPNLDVNLEKSVYDDVLRRSGYWVVDSVRNGERLIDIRRLAHLNLLTFTNVMQEGSIDSLLQQRCQSNQGRAQAMMSGTSMATPAVSGYVAKQIVRKAMSNPATRVLTEIQWYDHPELSPEKIISEILSSNPTMGGNSLLKDVRLIPEIMRWKPHPARLEKLIGIKATDLLRSP